MGNDDETNLICKRGTNEEYEREDMLLEDFRTEIAPDRDGDPGNEEWNEACEGGENSEALGAASMDDVQRAIRFKSHVSVSNRYEPE